jgi:hypothetical protein
MDHKGVEFEVVQISNPCCWKWTVFIEPIRLRSGVALTRTDAVLDAELAIERALERQGHSMNAERRPESSPRSSCPEHERQPRFSGRKA